MKLTIVLADLESLLKTIGPRPKPKDTFVLSACAGRVFAESKGDIGGVEALVFEDGAVTLPTKKFREMLKTYKGRTSLTLEASPTGLFIGTFRMPVSHYNANPIPPGDFKVFRTTAAPTTSGPLRRLPGDM